MSYGDIRFSGWDDPDDDDQDTGDDQDTDELDYYWPEYDAYDDGGGYYEPPQSECVMCGKERSVNSEGYCGQCWVVWNS